MKNYYQLIVAFMLMITGFSSCNKERIVSRNLKNTMWKITTLEEKPISNEFGPIQCAIDTFKLDAGGFTFADGTSGKAAFQFASDSLKTKNEFFWQVVESDDAAKSELQLEDAPRGFSIHFIIDPKETRKDNMILYYEKVNACGDLVRYTFSLERFEYAQ